MNLKKITLFSFVLVIFIAYSVTAETPSSFEQVSTWSKEQVNQFLNKYHLTNNYKNSDWDQVLKRVQRYQQEAKEDAKYFGIKINHFLNGARIQLQENKDLNQQQLDGYINDMQHQLRQLELQGSLTSDKVQQTLDKYYRKLVKNKVISESTLAGLKNEIQSTFQSTVHQPQPRWYQRIFSFKSHPYTTHVEEEAANAKSSVNQWLDHVQERLKELNVLTNEQLDIIREQLNELITSKRLHKLASPHWYQRLYHRLEKHAQLTQDQLDQIKDTLEDEVNAYKIFVMDYLEETKEQTKQWMGGMYGYGCNVIHQAKHHVEEWYHHFMEKLYDALSTSHTKSKAMIQQSKENVKEKASSTVDDMKSSVKENQQDIKNQFDRYWKNKHLEAYRRLGYTEAQIDQIKNQWAQFIQQQQNSVDHSLDQLKNYLQSTKVQTSSQIQKDMQELKKQLDEWKNKIITII
ncbi:hypothetical protein BJ944DRAFT_177200 [Cunninghamella echinulata]|nr:hypothetical protein BJ944DRAFT_177200 [Cunninghamella echinulata]